MNKVIQATYHDGNLVLDEKLDAALEGQKVTLILVDQADDAAAPNQGAIAAGDRQQRFLDFLEKSKQYSAKLPPDYKFDREAAHEQ